MMSKFPSRRNLLVKSRFSSHRGRSMESIGKKNVPFEFGGSALFWGREGLQSSSSDVRVRGPNRVCLHGKTVHLFLVFKIPWESHSGLFLWDLNACAIAIEELLLLWFSSFVECHNRPWPSKSQCTSWAILFLCLAVDVQSHFTRLLPPSSPAHLSFPSRPACRGSRAAFWCVRPTMQLSVHSAKFRNFAISTLRRGALSSRSVRRSVKVNSWHHMH